MGGHRGGDVASRLDRRHAPGGAAAARPLRRGPPGCRPQRQPRRERALRLRSRPPRHGHDRHRAADAGDSGRIAHVGDSRAYLLRDGALQQLTQDHTLVQQMVDEGNLDADEAERHPARHIMTRALGVEEQVAVDQLTLDLHPGDRILLCSDGLTGMLVRRRHPRPDGAGRRGARRRPTRWSQLAVERGGEDNVTVVVVDARGGRRAGGIGGRLRGGRGARTGGGERRGHHAGDRARRGADGCGRSPEEVRRASWAEAVPLAPAGPVARGPRRRGGRRDRRGARVRAYTRTATIATTTVTTRARGGTATSGRGTASAGRLVGLLRGSGRHGPASARAVTCIMSPPGPGAAHSESASDSSAASPPPRRRRPPSRCPRRRARRRARPAPRRFPGRPSPRPRSAPDVHHCIVPLGQVTAQQQPIARV